MKVSFNLLVLGDENESRLSQLRSLCLQANVPLSQPAQLHALSPAELAQQVVLVAGSCSAEALLSLVHKLADAGAVPILVVDALWASASSSAATFASALVQLAEDRIQTAVVAQVKGLVQSTRLMLYKFPKADSTATIMVVIGAGTAAARVLTITRLHPPYQDQESFPGGFLNPHTESLPGCGAREGSEEASVAVPEAELVLLDVRSRPERDERGHVVDHGYMWLVPQHLVAEVEASVQAGDDAKADSARFVSVSALLTAGSMAFDHYDLLLAAVRTGKVLPPARLVVRLLRAAQSFCNRLALYFERGDSVYGRFHH
jgi:ADP-ribose pyrophosphatase YjhB (NUDIX family)